MQRYAFIARLGPLRPGLPLPLLLKLIGKRQGPDDHDIGCWNRCPTCRSSPSCRWSASVAIVFLVKKENTKAIQVVAFATIARSISVLLPLFHATTASTRADVQFVEHVPWITVDRGPLLRSGSTASRLLLILLTTLLGFISVYCSYTAINHRQKEYYVARCSCSQTGMLGVFCALDFVLFYVFWEVMLVPMYFLIGVWGGPRKLYAAIKFFLYTLSGSVLMLLGILALYFWNTDGSRPLDRARQRADLRHR